MWSFGVVLHGVSCLYLLPTPPTCGPSTTYYSRYMSPLMDIKCFLFASLFCTYIRDRKPISSSINRADVHTHAHTHTQDSNPSFHPLTAGWNDQKIVKVKKEGKPIRGLGAPKAFINQCLVRSCKVECTLICIPKAYFNKNNHKKDKNSA